MSNILKISALLILSLFWACNPEDDVNNEPNNTFRLDEYQSNWQKRKIDDRPLSDLPGALPGMYSQIVTKVLLTKGDTIIVYSNRNLSNESCFLYSSYDKGMSWNHLCSMNGKIKDAAYIGGDTVYVLREYLNTTEFGKSYDAGLTWIWANIPSDPYAIAFANSETGLAIAADGVYKSTSGGAPWTKVSSDLLNTIMAINDSTYIGLTGSEIMKTSDEGNSWTSVHSAGFELVSLYMSPHNVLYAGGFSGSVFRSFDEGSTWVQIFQLGQIMTGIQYAGIESFCMVDSLNGFAAISFTYPVDLGSNYDNCVGIILRTPDAGENWMVNYYSEIVHYTDIIAQSGPVVTCFGTQKEDNVWSGIYSTRTQTLGN